MPKIVIFGGSSEIGNAIARKLSHDPKREISRVIRVSSSLMGEDIIRWKPRQTIDVLETIEKIPFEKGDIVIVALGSLGNVLVLDAQTSQFLEWNSILSLNFNIAATALLLSHSALQRAGGGTIVVLGSAAAFPVLKSNFYYGSAKLALDSIAYSLQEFSSTSRVSISIVRSAFVPTKLNKNRRPTPLSLSAEQVAALVHNNLGARVIWTPRIFKYISLILRLNGFARKMANKSVTSSYQSEATS